MATQRNTLLRARGLSFREARPVTHGAGRRALLAPSPGLRKNIGPRSWKHIPLRVSHPPLPGTSRAGGQMVLMGIGSQTLRAQGPTVF